MATTRNDNHNYSPQESNHPATRVYRYGSTALTEYPRAIHSNVTRHLTLTFANGSSALMLLNSGQTYPFSVTLVTSSTATAIAAVSTIVFPIY